MMRNETQGEEKILVYGAEGASEMLECMLKGYGYGVERLDDAGELAERFQQEEALLLLFDFQTEAGNQKEALTLLADLRRNCKKPIVAIVDREREMLRILALNAGADDLLDQGCSAMESLARIQAQIRCFQRLSAAEATSRRIRLNDLEIDDRARLVTVKGRRVDLTPTEYKILRLLLETPGRVLSNRQIYERIWKMTPIGADNTVAVHIRHIREKIEENPQEPRYLQVVWGQGYKVG
ncbi:MAG: response regulator transcription factor [Roseburia sp.]|nr:response regulator transcription factor [Roseburia sp.]MCM1097636.1 response regulator transcription factor [Ruminococcus flavefaciens]